MHKPPRSNPAPPGHGDSMTRIATQVGGDTGQPVAHWNPPLSGELDLCITRRGEWHYLGDPIRRERLVTLFARILRREPDGDYYLVTPVEKWRIRVEDAPFIATEMERAPGPQGSPWLWFTTNVGDRVRADETHPIRVETDPVSGEPAPYLRIRDGLEALISRPLFYRLVELAEETVDQNQGRVMSLPSGTCRFVLGAI